MLFMWNLSEKLKDDSKRLETAMYKANETMQEQKIELKEMC